MGRPFQTSMLSAGPRTCVQGFASQLPVFGGGGLTAHPLDPDLIVGKNEIYKREYLCGLFLVRKLLDFWVPRTHPVLLFFVSVPHEFRVHGRAMNKEDALRRLPSACTTAVTWRLFPTNHRTLLGGQPPLKQTSGCKESGLGPRALTQPTHIFLTLSPSNFVGRVPCPWAADHLGTNMFACCPPNSSTDRDPNLLTTAIPSLHCPFQSVPANGEGCRVCAAACLGPINDWGTAGNGSNGSPGELLQLGNAVHAVQSFLCRYLPEPAGIISS